MRSTSMKYRNKYVKQYASHRNLHYHKDETGMMVKCYHGARNLLVDYRFWIGMTMGYPLEHWLWEKTFLSNVLHFFFQ